jgi:hypothetical protein
MMLAALGDLAAQPRLDVSFAERHMMRGKDAP